MRRMYLKAAKPKLRNHCAAAVEKRLLSRLGLVFIAVSESSLSSENKRKPLLVGPDAYICMECESSKTPALPKGPCPSHELDHFLVRISDSAEDVEVPDTDTRISALEKKLAEMQTKVEDRLNSLEEKVDGRFSALEAKVDERLASMEQLLRQIIQALPQSL